MRKEVSLFTPCALNLQIPFGRPAHTLSRFWPHNKITLFLIPIGWKLRASSDKRRPRPLKMRVIREPEFNQYLPNSCSQNKAALFTPSRQSFTGFVKKRHNGAGFALFRTICVRQTEQKFAQNYTCLPYCTCHDFVTKTVETVFFIL